MAKKNFKFKDFSFNFAQNPFNGDISTVVDDKAIVQSLQNIVLSDRFDAPFQSDFGGNINALLFELPTAATKSALEERIRLSIENYEPRVEVIDITVQDMPDLNSYEVTIIFTSVIAELPVTVSLFLERVL